MAKGTGPKLPKITDAMREWSALLGAELATLPDVTTKPMFGMIAYYRGPQIFAVLPRTRAFESAKAVGFRMHQIDAKAATELKRDRRVLTNPIGACWISFEIDDPDDLNAALQWMLRAYEQAKKPVKAGARRKRQP